MSIKRVYMSNKEQFTYNVLRDFENRTISRTEAAALLSVDERTITRKAKSYRIKGLLGLIHGNQGRSPTNKKSEELREHVLKIIREKYFDFNVSHCLEMLAKYESIKLSYGLLHGWCRQANLIKRPKRRRAAVRHLRARLPCEGLMLQMDGSHHAWNGKDEWVLIAAIDDATSKIPWAEFFISEDTLNCMTVLQRIIETVGIPEVIYTDKAGWFGGTTKREGFSHFVAACEELGIRLIFANSPQGKGRIERAWDTFQDRIIPEFRLGGIRNIRAANEYLQNEFIPNYWNKQNIVAARLPEIKYRPLAARIDLNQVLCLKDNRVVKSDHTISWDGRLYRIFPVDEISIKSRKIELRTYQDLTTKAFFAGRELRMEIVETVPIEKPLRSNGIPGVNRAQMKAIKNSNLSPMTKADIRKQNEKNKVRKPHSETPTALKRKRGRPKKYYIDNDAA